MVSVHGGAAWSNNLLPGYLLVLDANTHVIEQMPPVVAGAHGIAYAGDMR